jgi:hypothetical protein
MATAKEVIIESRNFFANLVREDDKKFKNIYPTYGETVDRFTRVGYERALAWVLAVMESEEDGTLDEKLKALTSKPKKRK